MDYLFMYQEFSCVNIIIHDFRPVSAYALFFRDTQAAIKGQNPNATFGEVSKIVASMWESLDPEHKNVSDGIPVLIASCCVVTLYMYS